MSVGVARSGIVVRRNAEDSGKAENQHPAES